MKTLHDGDVLLVRVALTLFEMESVDNLKRQLAAGLSYEEAAGSRMYIASAHDALRAFGMAPRFTPTGETIREEKAA